MSEQHESLMSAGCQLVCGNYLYHDGEFYHVVARLHGGELRVEPDKLDILAKISETSTVGNIDELVAESVAEAMDKMDAPKRGRPRKVV